MWIKVNNRLKITLLCDNKESWIVPYLLNLKRILETEKNTVLFINNIEDLKKGDLLFILGCEKIIKKEYLKLNKYNIVVHESDLPKGKGWSPITWQVLEGENDIKVTLFEAVEKLDAGDIYIQKEIKFDGTELNDEIKNMQGKTTIEAVIDFIKLYPNINGKKQIGKETFYRRRNKKDSEIDINKSINEQFNLLRVVDNERYPAYFIKNEREYIIKIYREKKWVIKLK